MHDSTSPSTKEIEVDWLTHLYLYGHVTLRLDMANTVPAFPRELAAREEGQE